MQDQDYWLNSCGVFTTADQGQSWTLVGRHFPHEWIAKRLVRSGPIFGKDARQMRVLCLDHVAESLDGGQSWHVLAELPTRLTDHPWAHSSAYGIPRPMCCIATTASTAAGLTCLAGWR